MSDRLEQALEQELDQLLRTHDPDQPVNVDGEFVLGDEEKEAVARLEQLCVPPPTRGIMTLNDQAWAIQFRKAFLGVGLSIPQMGGGILFSFVGVIQAILVLRSSIHKLNKAEVFLIALLADTAEKKLDQKTLKATFLKKAYCEKSEPEFIFERALDHLIELRIVALQNPFICLVHTVLSLPAVKTMPRPKPRAERPAAST